MSNAVAEVKKTEMSVELMDDILDSAGEGTTFSAEEMQMPRIKLLQKMSPEIDKKDAKFIQDASPGDMANDVTKEFLEGKKGMTVVPVYQTTSYTEFTPKEKGGGYIGTVNASDPRLSQTERNGSVETFRDNGNELVKSDDNYCLIVAEDGSYSPALIGMKSSSLKVSRRWKTQIALQSVKHPKTDKQVKPALFATMWKLGSVEESRDGNTWSIYTIEKIGLVNSRDLLQEAKTLRESIASGQVKATPENNSSQVSGSGLSSVVDDAGDIPF